ncbi:hypothetical protein DLH72_00850 [Candidatus Gracilibacteria bacterium]|nr:MAG: hypothetical protein DLH72_00850 [Candidatus Gracilibacteria bacterium]
MVLVLEKIKEYLEKNTVRTLQEKAKVGSYVIYDLEKEGKKVSKKVLDRLYNFFELEKDDFYFSKLSNYKGYIYNPLGELLRKRREKLGFSREQIAKMIKGTDRHIRRLENGDMTYGSNYYYVKEILKLYKFSKIEENQILSYVSTFSIIIELSKKENT